MRKAANSQTMRKPSHPFLALALLLAGAAVVVVLMLESPSTAFSARLEVNQIREATTDVESHQPEANSSNSRVDQTPTKKRARVVYLGSNRQVETRDGRLTLGKQPGSLVLGRACTTVGSEYQPGELTDIRIESLTIYENPDDLNALFPDPKAKTKPVLVFVHGFYVEFEEAIQRVTQIVHELDFDGHVVLYTWPSVFKVTLEGYGDDQQAIQASVNSCCRFIGNLSDHFGAQNVQVLAHSLGCRLIAKTLHKIHREEMAGSDPLIQNLIFAAPDIELDNFHRYYLSALTTGAQRVSIYFSSKDATLELAERLDGRPPRLGRIGLPRGSHPVIEAVDYSSLPGGLWNMSTHNLYREHPAIVQDLRGVLSGSTPLSDRKLKDGLVQLIVQSAENRKSDSTVVTLTRGNQK
ncbi:MAG: alpha/beta hydrolase [Planctomycetaceae bacterium]|nr:alpha/beta hydrolase [Planctomycetaceae bacterium]